MAIEAQGTLIRRQSTTAGSTGSVTAATIAFSSVAKTITRSDAGDFTVDGFSTGMRIENTSTANSTRVNTLASVAATSMTVYEPIITQSSGISITITGHSFENIAKITNFSGPTGSAGVIDITTLGSTAKEKLIGIRDEGQLTMDVVFDNNATSLHPSLREDRASRTLRLYDIKLTDNGTASNQPSAFYLDAYVTGFSIAGAVDDKITGNLTLEITSAVRTIEAI